ncbi:elongation factor P hydroxylase [Alteromonadaceae bacterium BrNp21-10]|nr:elongation factor P hydroxylase [Alteromonadaceae bacterium BrNp21-10]
MHQVDDLIGLFEAQFYSAFNTRLVRGTDEPIYLPAGEGQSFAQIVFAHGYYASALHEIAHWCLAGLARLDKVDYGYWYCPDGRNAEQQAAFEKVEIKPQAIEWAMCLAAGKSFRVSTDNLNGVEPDHIRFENNVRAQLQVYLQQGFPARAQQFIDALQQFYGTAPLSQNILKQSALIDEVHVANV